MSTTTVVLAILSRELAAVLSGLFGVGGGILFVPVLVGLGLGAGRGGSDVAARDRADRGASARGARPATATCASAPRSCIGVASIAGVEAGVQIATSLPEHVLRRLFGVLLARGRRADRLAGPAPPRGATLRPRETRLPPRGRRSRRRSSSRSRRPRRNSPRRSRPPLVSRIAAAGAAGSGLARRSRRPRRRPAASAGYVYPEDGSIVRIGSADAQRRRPAGRLVERAGERSAPSPCRSSAARSRPTRSTCARAPPRAPRTHPPTSPRRR